MVCERFKDYDPDEKNSALLEHIKNIVNEYMVKDLKLTCRQLYYQMVSRNIITNNQKSYNNVTMLVNRGRMAGMLDWSAIVDRNRESTMHYYNINIEDAINDALAQYRRNLMLLQKVHIEVMIEKMAIFDIVQPITNKYSLRLTGDKGFCSNTVLYDISKRIISAQQQGENTVILYVGDHDPSGLQMDETIQKTLTRMGANGIEFRRVALTAEQVKEYNLPPNLLKEGDKNSSKYKTKHGSTSWECDALPPEVLADLIETEIRETINLDDYYFMLEVEERDKKRLQDIISNIKATQQI